MVSPVELPGNSIITIIDHDGTVIMRSPGSQNWIGKATRGTEIVDLVLAGDQGQKIGRGVDGKQRIYGFATIPKSGWKVYAGIPTSFVLAAARANTWRASVAAGALFALIMGLVILLSRLINEPVSALFRAAPSAKLVVMTR